MRQRQASTFPINIQTWRKKKHQEESFGKPWESLFNLLKILSIFLKGFHYFTQIAQTTKINLLDLNQLKPKYTIHIVLKSNYY